MMVDEEDREAQARAAIKFFLEEYKAFFPERKDSYSKRDRNHLNYLQREIKKFLKMITCNVFKGITMDGLRIMKVTHPAVF